MINQRRSPLRPYTIKFDYPANVIQTFINQLVIPKDVLSDLTVDTAYELRALALEYECEGVRKLAAPALESAIKRNPWSTLKWAATKDDVELAKKAFAVHATNEYRSSFREGTIDDLMRRLNTFPPKWRYPVIRMLLSPGGGGAYRVAM